MRGTAGGWLARARPSVPHGGSVLAPHAPWSTSAPGLDASRALVSVVSPLQPPKGTGRGNIRLYVHPIISPSIWDLWNICGAASCKWPGRGHPVRDHAT